MPEADIGPFLNEEDNMLDIICHRLEMQLSQKIAEEQLKFAHNKLNNIINFLPDATFVVDGNGTVIAWNKAIEEMTGVRRDDILGRGDLSYSHALYGIKKPIIIDFLLNPEYEIPESYNIIQEEKDVISAESYLPGAFGGKGAYVLIKASSLFDEKGNMEGAIESIRDITLRKKAEDALNEVNKKLNLLSSITRHDILNQITGAAGYIQLLEMNKEIPPDSKEADYIKKISGAVETIKKQILFTRDYKDLGEQAPDWFNVGKIISDVSENSIFGEIKIRNDMKNTEVFADPLFEKVIYNLFDNAVKHGEKITKISFTAEESPEGLVITCEDDGIGIPDEAKEKIFRREYFKNSGLGLFLSREILGITGITIKETGKYGEGARFEILVPEGKYRFTE